MFVTINPSSFEGREAFSQAWNSRCTQVKLFALSQSEMESMVQKLPNMPQGLSQWLAMSFHQLSTKLNNHKSPVQLTLDDLLSSAKYLANKGFDQWQNALQEHLPLPFGSLTMMGLSLFTLKKDSSSLVLDRAKEQHRLACEKEINSISGLADPITVKLGDSFCINGREVTVNLHITVGQVVDKIKSDLQKCKVKGNYSA